MKRYMIMLFAMFMGFLSMGTASFAEEGMKVTHDAVDVVDIDLDTKSDKSDDLKALYVLSDMRCIKGAEPANISNTEEPIAPAAVITLEEGSDVYSVCIG